MAPPQCMQVWTNIQLAVVVEYYNDNSYGEGMRQKSVEAWMVLND